MPGEYVISKRSDGWVVAVDGSPLLVCERKKAALRAIREAMARDAAKCTKDPHCRIEPQAEQPLARQRTIAAAG